MTDQPPTLLLIPDGSRPRPDPSLTQQALHGLGMIDEVLTAPGYFGVGEHFIDHVSFLGCSPDLRLEPEADDNPGDAGFIHVSLNHLDGELLYRQGRNPRPPLCPACRKPVKNIQNVTVPYTCMHCDAVNDPVDLVWRDGEVVSLDSIDIIGIFPREGVPTDNFMTELARMTGIKWRYLYL